MNAISLLEDQHHAIASLFARIEAEVEVSTRQRLFDEVADALAVHTTVEELLFYPAVEERLTDDFLLEAAEEHLVIKRVIADLLALRSTHRSYRAKVIVLRREVEQHVREERRDLLPRAAKLLGQLRLDVLGREMLAMTESLRSASPRLAVPLETRRAATVI